MGASPYTEPWPARAISPGGVVTLPSGGAERSALFEALIADKLVVRILFDARAPGVLGAHPRKVRELFIYGVELGELVRDLHSNAEGIGAALLLPDGRRATFVPWSAIQVMMAHDMRAIRAQGRRWLLRRAAGQGALWAVLGVGAVVGTIAASAPVWLFLLAVLLAGTFFTVSTASVIAAARWDPARGSGLTPAARRPRE